MSCYAHLAGRGRCARRGRVRPLPGLQIQEEQVVASATNCVTTKDDLQNQADVGVVRCVDRAIPSALTWGDKVDMRSLNAYQGHLGTHDELTKRTMFPAQNADTASSRGVGGVPSVAGRCQVQVSRSRNHTSFRRLRSAARPPKMMRRLLSESNTAA
eukprot:359006-Chlamydomonas_euryale.AAC.8